MFFSRPPPELPKITAPTAAEICAKCNPSPQARALLTPDMTPGEYMQALEKNKLPMDQVNFLSNGLPKQDAVCWACQSTRTTAAKLSGPEMNSLNATEAWLKNPTPDALASVQSSLGSVDYTGPGSWTAQAAAWSQAPAAPAAPAAPSLPSIPGVPATPAVNLTAAAVAGAVMLAAGLNTGPAMPAVPQPKLELPNAPLPPEMMAKLQQAQLPTVSADVPAVDQAKLVKPLTPYIDLGKKVANGSVSCT